MRGREPARVAAAFWAGSRSGVTCWFATRTRFATARSPTAGGASSPVMSDMKNATGTAGWAPWELVAAAGLGIAVTAGGVVWAGAALAALLSGERLDADLATAVRAAVALPKHLSDPAAAWPAGSAASLPGPWLYWPCTLLVIAALVGLGVSGWRLRARFATGRRRLGVDVRARFATRAELRPLLVRGPVSGRFVLGRWGRWLVATENRRYAPARRRRWGARASEGDVTSVAIIGPSRSGKTSECAIPGVLDWDGPAILLSVKRDLLDATIGRRRQLGQVRVFDPAGIVTATNGTDDGAVAIRQSEIGRWSPLRNAATPQGAKKAGAALAAWTPRAGIEDGGQFWESAGKILFTGLLGAAALDPAGPSMTKVAQWVFTQDMPRPGRVSQVKALLKAAAEHPDAEVVAAADAAALHLGAIWSKDERFASAVYGTAQTVADPYLDPAVQTATDLDANDKAGWIDLDWLMNTEDGKANTLYLVVPLDEYERLAPVLGGLLSDLKAQAYEWDVRGRRFGRQLLLLIDEAGNMPLAWLPQVASTCAGIGIQLVTIWQSLAQIEDAYGRQANAVITNHATKLFFPAASDDTTLSYQTRIAGHEEVERRSWSITGETGHRSVSGASQTEPLVPYHVPRLAPLGQALLIHGNMPPAVIRGRKWWRDRRLVALSRGDISADDESGRAA